MAGKKAKKPGKQRKARVNGGAAPAWAQRHAALLDTLVNKFVERGISAGVRKAALDEIVRLCNLRSPQGTSLARLVQIKRIADSAKKGKLWL